MRLCVLRLILACGVFCCFYSFFKIYASVALRAKCDYGHLMQEGDAEFNTNEHYFGMKQIYSDLLEFFFVLFKIKYIFLSTLVYTTHQPANSLDMKDVWFLKREGVQKSLFRESYRRLVSM